MTVVVTLEDYRPSPRYDSLPWTDVQIQEAALSTGPWVTLETQALSPVDADPENPAYRSFTTALGTAAEQWYRVIFLDALAATGLPTFPVQNVEDDRPVYASVAELASLLRVNASQRHNALMRVLKGAADEIDHEIGTADIYGAVTPYSNPPAIARQVNIERAVEHWRQEQSPFGIVGIGDDTAQYTARALGQTRAQARSAERLLGDCVNPQTIMQALADQIEGQLGTAGTASPTIDNLQVSGEMNLYPTPPSIDIYPAEPFETGFKMGSGVDMTFFVRARATPQTTSQASKQLLLSMMGDGDASLTRAIHSDRKLSGNCGSLAVLQVGGFGLFTDAGGEGSYMGALWTVRVVP